MTDRTDVDLAKVKARLLSRRDEVRRLTAASEADRRPVELDQARVGRLSRMDALQAQAMAKETERRRGVELRRIDAALERLDDGEFGFCLSCGEAIAVKRLELDPTTPICVDCASANGGPGRG